MTAEETKQEVEATQGKAVPEFFVRFALSQRIEHIVLMVTFTVLSVTGLAQRYYPAGWAEWLVLHMGGISDVRLVHRLFAVVFVLSMIYHFSYVGFGLFVRHARASMVPTLKDFRDVVSVFRYSLGFAADKPQFGRYDYRQKFEYWGLIIGSTIIIITGFFLAYPTAVTRVLPGQVIAASVEFHGFEATLAVLVIVIWHLYDVIFKPDIFPADTSIFTGKISRKRLMEEHSLEYAALVGAAKSPEKPQAETSDEGTGPQTAD